MTYRFVLIAEGPGGAREVDHGKVAVAEGASGTGTATFIPDVGGVGWILTVKFVGRAESIHFAATS